MRLPLLLLSLLLTAAAAASASAASTRPSLDCSSQCRGRVCVMSATTDHERPVQCVDATTTAGVWTLDLAAVPLGTQIQNVTYPETAAQIQRVVIQGRGTTQTMDASVLATPDSVTSLFVSGVYVPASIWRDLDLPKRKWQHVTLGNVGLTSVPTAFQSLALDTLNLPFNNLTDLNLNLPRLHALNLSGNPLTTIPHAVFNMAALTTLSLRQCKLTNVAVTPSQLAFLRQLVTLEIDLSVSECPQGSIPTSVSLTSGSVCLHTTPRSPAVAVSRVLSTDTSSTSKTVITIVIVVAAVLAVALLLYVAWRVCRSSSSKGSDYMQYQQQQPARSRPTGHDNIGYDDMFLSEAESTARSSVLLDPILQRYRIDKDALVLRSCLTTTGSSEVWVATYAEQTVVVKKLGVAAQRLPLAHALASSALDYFVALDHAGVSNHRNIVHVLGVSWSSALTTQVLMAYAEGGDLRTLLDSKEAEALTWSETKCQLLLNVVDALAFLEAQAQRPPNGSLVSSRNVLLDATGTAQLSVVQFGFEDADTLASSSSIWYVAPEILLGEKATTSALMYSLGVLLAELDSTARLFDDVLNPSGQKAPDAVILKRIAKGDLQPTLRDDCPERLAALARACWAFDPTERPTAQRVAYTLRDVLKNEL